MTIIIPLIGSTKLVNRLRLETRSLFSDHKQERMIRNETQTFDFWSTMFTHWSLHTSSGCCLGALLIYLNTSFLKHFWGKEWYIHRTMYHSLSLGFSIKDNDFPMLSMTFETSKSNENLNVGIQNSSSFSFLNSKYFWFRNPKSGIGIKLR